MSVELWAGIGWGAAIALIVAIWILKSEVAFLRERFPVGPRDPQPATQIAPDLPGGFRKIGGA